MRGESFDNFQVVLHHDRCRKAAPGALAVRLLAQRLVLAEFETSRPEEPGKALV